MKVYSIILLLISVEKGKHMAKFIGAFLKLGTIVQEYLNL
jgi:hypothetical protein